MGIKFYDSNGKYWGEYDETRSLFIPSEETITQTETQNSNLTFEKADERCKGCNHYKLTCDLFSEICRYEPKDEPQTDYTPDCPFCKRYGTEDCLGSDCRHYKTYKTEPQTERSE